MPLGLSQCLQLLVVVCHVWLSVVGNGSELAVVLELVFQLGQFRDDPFPLP